jgi:hypothetical protein
VRQHQPAARQPWTVRHHMRLVCNLTRTSELHAGDGNERARDTVLCRRPRTSASRRRPGRNITKRWLVVALFAAEGGGASDEEHLESNRVADAETPKGMTSA